MRSLSLIARLTLAAAAVLASSLVSAPSAEGALLPGRRHRTHRTCEASALSRTERARFRRLANPECLVLRDVAASLERGARPTLDDAVVAIQNDAPAMPLDTGWRAAPLRPIGRLAGTRPDEIRLRSCSRRSPRGPPFS